MLISPAQSKFNHFDNKFEIQLSFDSEVILDDEEKVKLPMNVTNLKSIMQIESSPQFSITGLNKYLNYDIVYKLY